MAINPTTTRSLARMYGMMNRAPRVGEGYGREAFLNSCGEDDALASCAFFGQDFTSKREARVSSEFAASIRARLARRTAGAVRRQRRILAVQLLGPLTMLAGLVWAIAQPYRIAFLYPDGKGLYDYVAQPPLLVVLVGLVFMVLVAPGLADDLEDGGHGPEG
jgi:hypothetical protein